MDVIEILIYLFFLIIFLVSRYLRSQRKVAEERKQATEEPVSEQPTRREQPAGREQRQEAEREKRPSFDDVFREIFDEFEDKEEEIKEPAEEPNLQEQDIPGAATEREKSKAQQLMEEGISAFEDRKEEIYKEGGTSLYKTELPKMKGPILEERSKEKSQFDFDPRQAYMMKILLDRPKAFER